MAETVAPVSALASFTVPKMGTPSKFSPAFLGCTPATNASAPLAYWRHIWVWNWPVLPVIPWVMTLVSLLIRIDIYKSSAVFLFRGGYDFGRGFGHSVGADDGQTRLSQQFLAKLFVRAFHAYDQRYAKVYGLTCRDHAF